MSWDVLVVDLPADATSLVELPDDYHPMPLGARDEVIAAIQDVAPDADFTDPSWGQLVTTDLIVEFNIGSEEPVDSIMLHVRRGGRPVIELIEALLMRLGRRAVDCSSGDIFSPSASEESLRAWREYRDRVRGRARAQEESPGA